MPFIPWEIRFSADPFSRIGGEQQQQQRRREIYGSKLRFSSFISNAPASDTSDIELLSSSLLLLWNDLLEKCSGKCFRAAKVRRVRNLWFGWKFRSRVHRIQSHQPRRSSINLEIETSKFRLEWRVSLGFRSVKQAPLLWCFLNDELSLGDRKTSARASVLCTKASSLNDMKKIQSKY